MPTRNLRRRGLKLINSCNRHHFTSTHKKNSSQTVKCFKANFVLYFQWFKISDRHTHTHTLRSLNVRRQLSENNSVTKQISYSFDFQFFGSEADWRRCERKNILVFIRNWLVTPGWSTSWMALANRAAMISRSVNTAWDTQRQKGRAHLGTEQHQNCE